MNQNFERVGARTYMLDSGFLGKSQLAAIYYLDSPRPVLIETSGSLVAPEVIQRLKDQGINTLAYVIVSHIHLDHAGGAGHIIEAYPEAKLIVHPEGARHMANPERLHKSAERVYGKQAMTKKWGYMKPVPHEAIIAADDRSVLDIGDTTLQFLFTPGHAKHHLCVWDSLEEAVFLGDSAGVYVSRYDYQTPSAPPPDLDPYKACESLEKVSNLRPRVIYFTHYGPGLDPQRLLDNARSHYMEWLRVAQEGIAHSSDVQDVADRFARELDYRRRALPPEVCDRIDELVPHRVQAEGYLGYLRRQAHQQMDSTPQPNFSSGHRFDGTSKREDSRS